MRIMRILMTSCTMINAIKLTPVKDLSHLRRVYSHQTYNNLLTSVTY